MCKALDNWFVELLFRCCFLLPRRQQQAVITQQWHVISVNILSAFLKNHSHLKSFFSDNIRTMMSSYLDDFPSAITVLILSNRTLLPRFYFFFQNNVFIWMRGMRLPIEACSALYSSECGQLYSEGQNWLSPVIQQISLKKMWIQRPDRQSISIWKRRLWLYVPPGSPQSHGALHSCWARTQCSYLVSGNGCDYKHFARSAGKRGLFWCVRSKIQLRKQFVSCVLTCWSVLVRGSACSNTQYTLRC